MLLQSIGFDKKMFWERMICISVAVGRATLYVYHVNTLNCFLFIGIHLILNINKLNLKSSQMLISLKNF